MAAWAAACKVEGSTVLVPSDYEFLVGPISFSGPYCQPNIVVQVTFDLDNGGISCGGRKERRKEGFRRT